MRSGAIILVLAVAVAAGIPFLKARSSRKMDTHASGFPSEVVHRIDQARAEREKVRTRDPQFFAAVSKAMFEHDPIGINFETNTDEYEAEAGTVIPRLSTCTSVDDVVTVLHEEFVKWFGASTAGSRERYTELARDIWTLHNQGI